MKARARLPAWLGELLDNIRIREIKSQRLLEIAQLPILNREMSRLKKIGARLHVSSREKLAESLREVAEVNRVNQRTQAVQDDRHSCNRDGMFELLVVGIACSAHRVNDVRADVKRLLQVPMLSALAEEVSHAPR